MSLLLKHLLAHLFPVLATAHIVPDGGGGADRGDDFDGGDTAVAAGGDDKGDDKGDDDADAAARTAAEVAARAAKDAAGDDDDDDAAGDDNADKPRTRARIPKQRLDQEIQKRRAVEARAAEAEQRLEALLTSQSTAADVSALEKKISELDAAYDEAISDGEKAEAKRIKAELRQLERQLTRAEAAVEATKARTSATNEIRYDMALAKLEAEYPALDPDADAYDEAAAREVLTLLDAFKARGERPDLALQRAVRYVFGAAEKRGLRRSEEAEERTVATRKKVADAVARTPANLARHGTDSDKAGGGAPTAQDVAKMTQEKFAKLDEETLAKLRGDVL